MNAARKAQTADATPATQAEKQVFPTTEQLIKDGLLTKSARIRKLHELGMSIGDIARQETGGLYQHAYNVIKKPLKGRPEDTTATTTTTTATSKASTESTKPNTKAAESKEQKKATA